MDAHAVSGTVIEDTIVAAKAPWSRIIKKGEMLRMIDLHGKQAIDFLCYNAADPEDRYNACDTMKLNGSIFLGKGTVIYTGLDHALFTIVEDTCGFHDTIGGCCSSEINTLRYGVPWQPNCRDNFLTAIAPFGLGRKDIVTNINFFMYVPVGKNGEMGMGPSISKPGDYVDLRAEMDVIAALSNCPQVNNPVNDFNPTPVRVIVWRPE